MQKSFLTVGLLSLLLVGCGGGTSSSSDSSSSSQSKAGEQTHTQTAHDLGKVIGNSVEGYDSTDVNYAHVKVTVTPYEHGFKVLWHPLKSDGYFANQSDIIQGSNQYAFDVLYQKKKYEEQYALFQRAGQASPTQGYIESGSNSTPYYVDTTWVVLDEAIDGFDPKSPYEIQFFNFPTRFTVSPTN